MNVLGGVNVGLPELLKEIATKYLDGRKDAFWQHKQSGQWLIKHRDLEIAAGRAGIWFDPPTMYESDASRSVAMLVIGHLGDNQTEWSIGEASPKNTQQAYPYAMAEKRAKDRVILKLFGIHGHAYSEEEADSFKEEPAKPEPKKVLPAAQASKVRDAITAVAPMSAAERAEWVSHPENMTMVTWLRDKGYPEYQEFKALGVE